MPAITEDVSSPLKATPCIETDDDSIPRDLDELCRELERRLEGLADADVQ